MNSHPIPDRLHPSQNLLDFWLEWRAASDLRQYPTIWRIRLLLTSRVWDAEKDARMWENEAGQIIGFAMLWRRYTTSPYVVLEPFVHPTLMTDELLADILQWGNRRAHEIAVGQEVPFMAYTSGYQPGCSGQLLKQGYTPIPPNPVEHDVHFARPLKDEIPALALPAGYTIRHLQSVEDLAACQAISGFAKVHPQHQKELLESNEYCHLVVLNPGGEFAAYCECSISRAEWERTGQRLGWIDYIETRPEQQKKGLGRAILLEGLRQLQAWGAETAMLLTISTNTPAVNLYNKTGFEVADVKQYPSYQKQVA